MFRNEIPRFEILSEGALETVERGIEARIDWQHFSVTRGQHTTYVKPFPISVAPEFVEDPPEVSRAALRCTG